VLLSEWIAKSGFRRIDVARSLGISTGHLTDLCNNRIWPTRSLFRKMWRLTSGSVTPNDVLWDNRMASSDEECRIIP
jgi:hypothetical protein